MGIVGHTPTVAMFLLSQHYKFILLYDTGRSVVTVVD